MNDEADASDTKVDSVAVFKLGGRGKVVAGDTTIAGVAAKKRLRGRPKSISQLLVDDGGFLYAVIEKLMPLLSVFAEVKGPKQEAGLHDDLKGITQIVSEGSDCRKQFNNRRRILCFHKPCQFMKTLAVSAIDGMRRNGMEMRGPRVMLVRSIELGNYHETTWCRSGLHEAFNFSGNVHPTGKQLGIWWFARLTAATPSRSTVRPRQ